jgi:hypothetical protein
MGAAPPWGSGGPPGPPPPRAPSRWGSFVAYLCRHPILCLALLTPGIPEYLSTSSSLALLVLSPGWFFLAIAINVGQYTAGALLIREAMIRWGKGWGSVFLLGGAYGITEEGLGDNTLFNPHGATPPLGAYGHFLGVNWVWSVGVLTYHILFSIGLPILLLGLALPETRGRNLIGRRGIQVCLLALAGSTALETTLVWGEFHFWMGTPILLGALVVIGVLILAAYLAPPELWTPRTGPPKLTPRFYFGIGFAIFLIATVIQYGLASDAALPPLVPIVGVLIELAIILEVLRRTIGTIGNEYVLVMFAFGSITYLAAFGLLVSLTMLLPASIPLIVLMVLFFQGLRVRYASPPFPVRPIGVGPTPQP